nr:MAG TPA: hypothetical protein [Caudoviricetes sp.]
MTSFLSFFRVLELISSSVYRFIKLLVVLLYFIDNVKQCWIVLLCSIFIILYGLIYYRINVVSSFLRIFCCVIRIYHDSSSCLHELFVILAISRDI